MNIYIYIYIQWTGNKKVSAENITGMDKVFQSMPHNLTLLHWDVTKQQPTSLTDWCQATGYTRTEEFL